MLPSLLIMVREGFEAALIVAIVFAYLRKIDRRDLHGTVWAGVGAAFGLSLALGVVVHLTLGSLQGAARLRAFAAISLAAAAVLTWMVFWMRRQGRAIKGELEHKIDAALGAGGRTRAIAAVAFLAVLREGVEAALFLVAAATSADGGRVVLGAVVGLAIASVLGVAVYAGGRRIPMRQFFQITGMVVVVFAAGLLARAVLFLQSSGDLGTVRDAVYDVTGAAWLTQRTEVGRFLAAMLGWDPRPSLEQVAVWLGYLVPVSWLFLRTGKPAALQAASPPAAAPGADRPVASRAS